ncbi:MAG: glucose 1-dehydrogenase [Actinomycetota bacterium]|nr:glucose 1-dehydrogenase [Actinomycetota bacterium]
MKAIAVFPGRAGSAHLTDLPEPRLDDIPGGRGVRVQVLRVGLDGTDKEINAGEYGAPPPGQEVLVIGHESFGVVVEVGPAVTELSPSDYVVSRVRRAEGASVYDTIDAPDLTTEDTYYEHGISLVHGFLTEQYVEEPRYLIRVPGGLREVGVLVEPTSVVEKGLTVAYEVQRRLKVWQPRRAAVLGAGTIGLLATVALRLRGLAVVTFGREEPPHLNADLVEALGARYVSTRQVSLEEEATQRGRFDLVFEATGFSPLAFEAMGVLAKNGILVLSSVTGGTRTVEVPADRLNLEFVLGNRVVVGTVNANRAHFESGVRDLAMAEAQYPGWLGRLLTHPIQGLDNYEQALAALGGPGAIKVFVEVAKG